MQDLDGKQLPVLDITPAAAPEGVQDGDSDPAKAKVTRASSTKVSMSIKINTLVYRNTLLDI